MLSRITELSEERSEDGIVQTGVEARASFIQRRQGERKRSVYEHTEYTVKEETQRTYFVSSAFWTDVDSVAEVVGRI